MKGNKGNITISDEVVDVETKNEVKGLALKKDKNVFFYNDEGSDYWKDLCLIAYVKLCFLTGSGC